MFKHAERERAPFNLLWLITPPPNKKNRLLSRESCAVGPGEDQSGIDMREGTPLKKQPVRSKQTLTDYPMIHHSRVMGSANGPNESLTGSLQWVSVTNWMPKLW